MQIKNSHVMLGGAVVLATLSAMLVSSCKSTIPKGASAVKPFDAKRYMGKWYEIARLDFKHEKGLNNTTANYSLNDGKIEVINRGFNVKKNKWEQAIGKAKFASEPDEAALKVSFFGPFYSGYNVIALDPQYRYALIAGESLDYLWFLSRESTMPEDVKQEFLDKARAVGYETEELVWVKHDK